MLSWPVRDVANYASCTSATSLAINDQIWICFLSTEIIRQISYVFLNYTQLPWGVVEKMPFTLVVISGKAEKEQAQITGIHNEGWWEFILFLGHIVSYIFSLDVSQINQLKYIKVALSLSA